MARFRLVREILGGWFSIPWYPLALSAYPVLALLATNAGQVEPGAGVRPLVIAVLFGGIVFLLIWLIVRQAHRAAFLAALWLALFFSYGHTYIYLDEKSPESNFTVWLAIGYVLLFLLALLWASRPRLTFVSAAPTLNTATLALLVMSASQIIPEVQPRSAHALALPDSPIQTDLVRPENPPDVYLFVLDSYGRADLLRQAYGFDNSEFLNALQERGFYVAECSQSNYVRTELSMASALNMQYLQGLSEKFNPESTARRLLWESLKHNAVRYNFESIDYETVSFETEFAWLNMEDVDHFMSPPAISSGMTEFEGLFLRTTAARPALELGSLDPDAVLAASARDRFNMVFNSADDIARMPQPTFAYIHLISPHPPFVFDKDGNPTRPADFWNEKRLYPADLYEKGYVGQAQYLNKRLLQAVDVIKAESAVPPVIILMGDHGPWLQPKNRRMWALLALHIPGAEEELYPTISPVNIFRLVFNTYFGGKYDMLEDVSYFSPVPKLYDFSLVPQSCSE